jgi:hypothetical protein
MEDLDLSQLGKQKPLLAINRPVFLNLVKTDPEFGVSLLGHGRADPQPRHRSQLE